VDKVSINTAAVRNPQLVKEASRRFGKGRLVVAIDGKKNPPGSNLPRLEVVIKSGTEFPLYKSGVPRSGYTHGSDGGQG
jgi:cyclase